MHIFLFVMYCFMFFLLIRGYIFLDYQKKILERIKIYIEQAASDDYTIDEKIAIIEKTKQWLTTCDSVSYTCSFFIFWKSPASFYPTEFINDVFNIDSEYADHY